MTWIQSESDFIEGDVIRWNEIIWSSGRGKKHKPVGTQKVAGQITAITGDTVSLKVLKAEIVERQGRARLKLYIPGSSIRKKKSTLLKGSVERLPWSDESARAVLSKGSGPGNPG